MTTITASSYSPNIPVQPLNPLTPGQVDLLRQGKTYDVSQKVKTVIQNHLGYQGTDEFSTHFTKQEITFTLKNGNVAESRKLVLQDKHWMLSQNSAPATALDSNLTNQINNLVQDILSKIHQASQTNAPDSPAPAASVDGADRPAAAVSNVGLAEVNARLAALEAQIRANPTLEESLRVQQEILREIARLREALERQPHDNNDDRNALRTRVGQLEGQLREMGAENAQALAHQRSAEEALRAGQVRSAALHDELAIAKRELEALRAQKASLEQASAASSDDARSANSQLSQQIGKLEKQIQAQQIALGDDEQFIQAQTDLIAIKDKQLKELRTDVQLADVDVKACVATIKAQNKKLEDALAQLQQTNQKAVAGAQLLEAVRAEKAALEAKLGASTNAAQSANAELSQRIAELEKQIEADRAQLANDERLNKSQAEMIATQEKNLEKLGVLFNSNDGKHRTTIASLKAENKQLEAQFKEALASQTKTIGALETELRTLKLRLQEMRQAREAGVAASTLANQAARRATADVTSELAALMDTVKIAAANGTAEKK